MDEIEKLAALVDQDPLVLTAMAYDEIGKSMQVIVGEFQSISRRLLRLAEKNRQNSLFSAPRPVLLVETILDVVARVYGFTTDDLVRAGRARPIVRARHVAMYLCRQLTKESYLDLAVVFDRDHTSVMSGVDRISKLRTIDMELDNQLDLLVQHLTQVPESF